MGLNAKKLKSIALDLDTKALQEYYSKGDWHNAYNDISNFLDRYQFKHTQGSVYDSTTKFSDEGLGKLIETMCEKLTWFPQCVKNIRSYDQPVMIDYTLQIKDKFSSQDLSLSKEANKEEGKAFQEEVKKASQNLKLAENSKSKDRGLER